MKRIFKYLVILLYICSIFFTNYLLGFTKAKDSDNVGIKTLEAENKQLKDELNKTLELNELDKYNGYDYIKSNVLFRDVYDFSNTMTIKYGKDKDIKKGMAVMSSNGLVGIIDKVNKNTSVVKLLTSNSLNLSVAIDDNYGILQGSNNKTLKASKFNNDKIIMKDDEVYTSGLGLIKEGLYVGNVVSVKDINENIEQEVEIKSNVNFNNLKYVAIIRGINNDSN